MILAVLAERRFGFHLHRRQWAGVTMTATGLLLLVPTLPTHGGAHARTRGPA